MQYSIPAKPTLYNGRQYRSHLEARWAAFFDLLGWPVEYEPMDLGDWSPDFIINGKMPVLVEVKPITEFCSETFDKMVRAVTGKPEAELDLLLVGTRVGHEARFFSLPVLGWFGIGDDEAVIHEPNRDGFRFGLFSSLMSYEDRLTGEYDGDHHIVTPTTDIGSLWTEAANIVQFLKPNEVVR